MGAVERNKRAAEYGEEYDTEGFKRFLRGVGAFLLAPLDSLIGLGKSIYYFVKSPNYFNPAPDAKDKMARRLPWTVNLSRIATIAMAAACITGFLISLAVPIPGVAPLYTASLLGIAKAVGVTLGWSMVARFGGALLGGIIDYGVTRSKMNKIKPSTEVEYKEPMDPEDDYANKRAMRSTQKRRNIDEAKKTSTLVIGARLVRNAVAEGLCSEAGLEVALRRNEPKRPLSYEQSGSTEIAESRFSHQSVLNDPAKNRLPIDDESEPPSPRGMRMGG